jgi:hypothetical protein
MIAEHNEQQLEKLTVIDAPCPCCQRNQLLNRLLHQNPQTGQRFLGRLSLSDKLSIGSRRSCLPVAGFVAAELQRFSACGHQVGQGRRVDCFLFQLQGQSGLSFAAVLHLQRVLPAYPQMFAQRVDGIGRGALRKSG